jgi:hypothetical protein
MTLVHFDLRRGNFSTPTVGSVWLAPIKRVHVNETPDYIALPDPVEYPLVDGQVTVELRPNTGDWAWVCFEGVEAGITRTFLVPSSVSTLDYGDLQDVDPASLTPTANPEAAWWIALTALQAEVDALPTGGGSGAVASVNDKVGIVVLNKADIGLPNADNTSDANKPISTLQQIALDAKLDKFTIGNRVYGTDSSGNQSSFSVSTGATSTTLALRAAGGVLAVGDPTNPIHAATKNYVDLANALKVDKAFGAGRVAATDASNVFSPLSWSQAAALSTVAVRTNSGQLVAVDPTASNHLTTKNYVDTLNAGFAPLASPAFTGTPTGITKAHVGLPLVDNTADVDKPISALQQAALDAKMTKLSTPTTVYGVANTGAQAMISYTSSPTALTVMYRTVGGVTSVGEPTASTHAATKNYVDTADALNKIYVLGASDPATGAPAGAIIARLPAV